MKNLQFLFSLIAFAFVVPFFAYATTAFEFERISVSSEGEEGEIDGMGISPFSISGDGRYVIFSSQDPLTGEEITSGGAFLRDREEETTILISNQSANAATIARGGRYVAFESAADDIVAGDDNAATDVFVYDIEEETIERIEAPLGEDPDQGASEPAISPDGRFVTFKSASTNFIEDDTNGTVDLYLYDRDLDTFERINITSDEEETISNSGFGGTQPSFSDDGRYVAFIWDTNAELTDDELDGSSALYLRDRQSGTTILIADETAESGTLSSDGRYVVFSSQDTDITEDELDGDGAVFLKDLQEDTISFVADYAYYASLSEDGRFVSYVSCIGGFGNYPCHVFRFDSQTDETILVTEGAEDLETLDSGGTAMSSDGSIIVFRSNASNLVDDDTNGISDIFVWEEPTEEEEPEEEPEDDEEEEDDDDNSNKSSHRRSSGDSNSAASEGSSSGGALAELQLKLIELLQQLLLILSSQQ